MLRSALAASTIITIAILFGGVATQGLGYGYGYGETSCTSDAPENLTVTVPRDTTAVTFTWDAVEFSDCDQTEPSSYTVQVRTNGSALIEEYNNLTDTSLTLASTILNTNRAYKFRVRAVAVDDTHTSWSLYKAFRTVPDTPQRIQITNERSTSVYISWRNVKRSKLLRYYKVVVRQFDRVVFSKRVRTGLRKSRTGTFVRGLQPATQYNVKIRSVYSSSVYSVYARKNFTTLAL
ncbi:MAG: fibronectin type III domain-containing protein [Candidatus Kerfeldbacteria bacterium]|nr:fibronectin type III domain-containing protein [Candidatus Kerfeldbacteria bacterium]